MEKEKKKKNVKYVSSHIDTEDTRYELVIEKTHRETMFVSKIGNDVKKRKSVTVDGTLYKPLPITDPYIAHHIVRFPAELGNYEDRSSLIRAIDVFIRRYVSLTDVQYRIASKYILLTWIYEDFNELPYLRARGDYGSGKSRFLSVVGGLCYKAMFASGASTVAPLFHMINRIGGTLILDEADFRFSNESADITKILNNGNAKGFPVLRCQKTAKGRFDTVAYQVYGPKVIASRGDYEDPALESRCITFDMHRIGKASQIPVTLPDSFESEMDLLRSALLAYRFTEAGKKKEPFVKVAGLSPRSIQMYSPILSVVETNDDKELILAFARKHQAQIVADRGLETAAEVLRVISACLADSSEPLAIGTLTTKFISLYGNTYDHKISAKWMGGIVRKKLRLETRKRNGRYVIAENQKAHLQSLYESYDVL